MAARASHLSLLLLGIVLLAKYSTLVKAELPDEDVNIENVHLNSEEEDNDIANHALETRGFSDGDDDDGDEADDVGDAILNAGPGGTLNRFNNNGMTIGGTIINAGPGAARIFGNNFMPSSMTSTDKTVEVHFNGGLTLRGFKTSKKGVFTRNNQIFIGDKLICDDTNKSFGEPTYQKSADGSLWYTNIKLGKPMNKAEIDKFEADWAEHKKEAKEQAAKRAREQKERTDALNRRLKQEAEERDRQQKERANALNQRLKQEAEERERQRKQRTDALNQRLNQESQGRKRQQKEQTDALNARLNKQAQQQERRLKRAAEKRERQAKKAEMKKSRSFWDSDE